MSKFSCEVFSEVIAAIFEFVALYSDSAEHFVHCVFVIKLVFSGASDRFFIHCKLAYSKTENNIASDFASVEGSVEKSEFNGAFGENTVEI